MYSGILNSKQVQLIPESPYQTIKDSLASIKDKYLSLLRAIKLLYIKLTIYKEMPIIDLLGINY